MKTLPEKTFYNMGDFVIYVGEKEGRKLSDVFFKYKDFTVIARSAVYEGKGRFRFRGGSLIIKMEGKYFITFFDNYTLDTLRIVGPKKREMRIYKERIYNLVNISRSEKKGNAYLQRENIQFGKYFYFPATCTCGILHSS